MSRNGLLVHYAVEIESLLRYDVEEKMDIKWKC